MRKHSLCPSFPFHPFLVAATPALFLYAHNARRMYLAPAELLLPVLLAPCLALVLLLLLRLLLREWHRAGLAATLVLLVFFGWGHAEALLRGVLPWYHEWQVVVPAALVLAAGVVVIARFELARARRLSAVLNAVAVALLAFNLARALPAIVRHGAEARWPGYPAGGPPGDTMAAPDIYYIVPDGHGRSDILFRLYGHDNSRFVDSLRALGFFVADSARANYSQTYLSLGSALNMGYADSIAREMGPESDDRGPLARWLLDNRVMGELRRRGYRVVAFASGYTGTEFRHADEYLAPPGALSEFQNLFLALTPARYLLGLLPARSQHDLHRKRIEYAFDRLPRASRPGAPSFVFAHILAPHPPFLFGPVGERLSFPGPYNISDGNHYHHGEPGAVAAYVTGYRGQVSYVEERLLATVNRIIASSSRPAVIVIQADHGPGSRLNHDDPRWTHFPERQGILYAVLTPDREYPGLHPAMTPVNTFRLLFAHLFADTLAPLPDRSYFAVWNRPYEHFDVDEWQAPARRVPARAGVVAFRQAPAQPAEPGTFYARLVGRRLPGAKVGPVLLYLVDSLPTRGEAYARYRAAVAAGAVPDFGTEYEHFRGRHGADWQPVLALFFPLD